MTRGLSRCMIFNNLTWETEMTNRDLLERREERFLKQRELEEAQKKNFKESWEKDREEMKSREKKIDKFEPMKRAIIMGIRENREFHDKTYDSVPKGAYEKLIRETFFTSMQFFKEQRFVDSDSMQPCITQIEANTDISRKILQAPKTGEKFFDEEVGKILRFYVVYIPNDFDSESQDPQKEGVVIDISRGDFFYHSDSRNPAFDNLWDALEEIDEGKK